MLIQKHIVDEIYRRADILDVIGDYVQLKKKGSYYVGLSPFKDERTPSFTVTPSKGIYKCFSTGKGGTIINFLMEIEGISYRDALTFLAKRYSIDLELVQSDEQREERDEKESLYIVNEFACQYYQDQLWETEAGQFEGLEYLRKRGLETETIKKFELGYSPDQWSKFTDLAILNKYSEHVLTESGLSLRSEKNHNLLDRFRGRIMFPIRNAFGKLAGFGARQLKSDSNSGKYINSKDSIIYNKSQLLYGIDKARNSIRQHDAFILVEGYMDVISLHQAGFSQAIATCGTALSKDQIHLVKRLSQKAVLLYDQDQAGISATKKAIEICLDQGLGVKILELPDGQDPDSYIHEFGGVSFGQEYVSNQKDFLEYQFNRLKWEEIISPDEKSIAIQQLANTISLISDDLSRSLYSKELSEKIGIEQKWIEQEINKFINRKSNIQPEWEWLEPIDEVPENDQSPAFIPKEDRKGQTWYSERELLRLLLNYPNHKIHSVDEIGNNDLQQMDNEMLLSILLQEELSDIKFSDPVHERIRFVIFEQLKHSNGPNNFQAAFDVENKEIQEHVAELLSIRFPLSERWFDKEIMVPALDRNLTDSVEHSLAHFTLRRLNDLIRKNADDLKRLSSSKLESDQESLTKALKRKMLLEKKRKQITDELGIVII